jgi:hypothetical protein
MADCGTDAGYQRHRVRGQEPCELCREAHAAYFRHRRRESPRLAAAIRRSNRARSRALWRLADEYPERFQQLYDDEMAKERADAS